MTPNRNVGKGSKPRPTKKKQYDSKFDNIKWTLNERTNSYRQPEPNQQSNERDCVCSDSTDCDSSGCDNSDLRDQTEA